MFWWNYPDTWLMVYKMNELRRRTVWCWSMNAERSRRAAAQGAVTVPSSQPPAGTNHRAVPTSSSASECSWMPSPLPLQWSQPSTCPMYHTCTDFLNRRCKVERNNAKHVTLSWRHTLPSPSRHHICRCECKLSSSASDLRSQCKIFQ